MPGLYPDMGGDSDQQPVGFHMITYGLDKVTYHTYKLVVEPVVIYGYHYLTHIGSQPPASPM